MNLVCSIIFIITAIVVAIFDYKYQKIPFWIIIINYAMLSILIKPLFIVGILFMLLYKKLDIPIDAIYLFFIGYLTIINDSAYSFINIVILLVSIAFSKKDPMSFMIPIEIVCTIEILRRLIENG